MIALGLKVVYANFERDCSLRKIPPVVSKVVRQAVTETIEISKINQILRFGTPIDASRCTESKNDLGFGIESTVHEFYAVE